MGSSISSAALAQQHAPAVVLDEPAEGALNHLLRRRKQQPLQLAEHPIQHELVPQWPAVRKQWLTSRIIHPEQPPLPR